MDSDDVVGICLCLPRIPSQVLHDKADQQRSIKRKLFGSLHINSSQHYVSSVSDFPGKRHRIGR